MEIPPLPKWAILYCATHLIAAAIPIRSWPFTDYPMFSEPIYKDTPLVAYRYYAAGDNSLAPLPRAALSGYGLGDLNVTKLYLEGNHNAFREILRRWLLKPENNRVHSVELHRVTILRTETTTGSSFTESKEVLLTVDRGGA